MYKILLIIRETMSAPEGPLEKVGLCLHVFYTFYNQYFMMLLSAVIFILLVICAPSVKLGLWSGNIWEMLIE